MRKPSPRNRPVKSRKTRPSKRISDAFLSQETILHHLNERGRPCSLQSIARAFAVRDKQLLAKLTQTLQTMAEDGQLIQSRRGEYGLATKMDLVRGRVIGHADGYGFLVPDDGSADLFLSAKEMRSLLHGDQAVIHLIGLDHRGRRLGALVEVLNRANHQVVGRYFQESGIGFVVPDNKRIHQDILIPEHAAGGARSGQFVLAEIIEQPDRHRQPIGRVVEVIGDHMAPGMAVDVAIRAHGLPCDWPDAVTREGKDLGEPILDQIMRQREDIRDLSLVTIDGEDARDFDDAVYCERTSRGWRLLVAIADVSHYVLPGTALDEEARGRGNSVYFPDRVIPMLPEVLSNGLCSLNPMQDRLCMVCELTIDAKGRTERFRFFEGIMRSAARLTYTEVAGMLINGDPRLVKKYRTLISPLEDLYALYSLLLKRRQARGAIDFETTETRIVIGEDGRIEMIAPLVRNDAHRMIEEFMLAANVAAAEFLKKHRLPTLYRVHDAPGAEKLNDLHAFLAEFELRLGGGKKPKAKDYADLIGRVRGRPDAHLIETVLLQSLEMAVYSPENIGHFGLGFDAYAHFTSPIRRYPDLLVHRAIRHRLRGRAREEFAYDWDRMRFLGERCSMTERRADEATRDAEQRLKCEYMLDKVGEVFDGLVTAVTSFGLFVELDKIYVEGLVHVTALRSDYYHFDPVAHILRGERTGKSYRLRDRVTVRVVRADLDERKIDFEIVERGDSTVSVQKKKHRVSRRRRMQR
ncbi:MAG: ribonuclease R [Gammaproteobacteria bacterium]